MVRREFQKKRATLLTWSIQQIIKVMCPWVLAGKTQTMFRKHYRYRMMLGIIYQG